MGYGNWICLGVASAKGDFGLGGILLQLIKGSSTECICTHNSHLPALSQVVEGVFCTGCCLSTSLERHKRHYIALASGEFEGFHSWIHQFAQFIKDRSLNKSAFVHSIGQLMKINSLPNSFPHRS